MSNTDNLQEIKDVVSEYENAEGLRRLVPSETIQSNSLEWIKWIISQLEQAQSENEQIKADKKKYETLRSPDEWHEDISDVIWWRLPIEEPPYVGSPLDCDWIENYYTHWTYIVDPVLSEVKGNEHT